MEVRQRVYPPRGNAQSRNQSRGSRSSSVYPPKRGGRTSTNRQLARELDERLVELQALFEVSKTLNSSLQLKNILDTLLLTPMGKMMIGKGMVLLTKDEKRFTVETLKGISQSNIGKEIEVDWVEPSTMFITDSEKSASSAWMAFLQKLGISLIVPIVANNSCLGMMTFSGKISKENYSSSELEYLDSLANLAATAVENAMMFRELKDVNRKLDKKIQELNTLFEIGRELNSTLDTDKISSVLAYALMGELMVQRCAILVDESGKLQLKVCKGGDKNGLYENDEFLDWLKTLSDPMVISTMNSNSSEWKKKLEKAGDALIIPLINQDAVRGVVVLGEKITKGEYQEEEIEFLSTLGNAAMISLENARLFKETLDKQRLEEELAIAREIQQRLLPKESPKLEGYQISALNIPTHKVGGDSFDYFPIGADRYVVSIADVSGKGVPAALLMSNLQATLRAIMTAELSLEQIVGRINNFVYENTTMDKFITLFVGILDLSDNAFTYVNAGHNPPYLFHENMLDVDEPDHRLLDKGGLLLGMFPNAPYVQETVKLENGDWIVMFTDGISEAMNDKEEEFTEKRVEETIRKTIQEEGRTAATMIDGIAKAVKRFTADQPQSDDITLLSIHYADSNHS